MISACVRQFDSGDTFGAYGFKSCWTPYAQAIAAEYGTVVPYYLSIACPLTGAPQTRISIAPALEHDTLIFGAHLAGVDDNVNDNGQRLYINVKDLRSGISWMPGNPLMAVPFPALAGLALAPGVSETKLMPIQLLPDAFFLPANVELQLEWKTYTVVPTATPSITFLGVQLIHPREGKAPCEVRLSNGHVVRVGSRIPWMSSVGLGDETLTLGGGVEYTFNNNQRFANYTPPVDCDVEIHDLHSNFFIAAGGSSETPQLIMVNFSDTGEREMWSVNRAPAPAVLGSIEQIPPTAPLAKPYLLQAGRRLRFDTLNLSGSGVSNAYITVRGVQLCKY